MDDQATLREEEKEMLQLFVINTGVQNPTDLLPGGLAHQRLWKLLHGRGHALREGRRPHDVLDDRLVGVDALLRRVQDGSLQREEQGSTW